MDGEIRLYFRTSTGSQFSILVGRSDTVLQIGRKIERKVGIPISYQNMSLPDTPITDGTILDLEVVRPEPLIDLFIRPSHGDAFVLSLVPRNVTIRNIKEKIAQLTGIPITSQTLDFNYLLLHDHQHLNDIPIQDYAIVDVGFAGDAIPSKLPPPPQQGYNPWWLQHQLAQPPQYQPLVLRQPPQHQFGPQQGWFYYPPPVYQLVRQPSQPPQYLPGIPRFLQQPQLQHQLGLPTNSHQEMDSRQQSVHQPPPQGPVTAASGSGNQRLVQSMGVPTPPTQKINLTLRMPKNYTQLDLDKSQTIRQIKKTIEDIRGVSAERLTLFFNTKKLEDSQTLGSYEIRDGSVIDGVVDDLPSLAPMSESCSGNKNK